MKKKTYTIIAGINGAGKTSLYNVISSDPNIPLGERVNIDEIVRRYSPQIGSRLQGSFQRLTFVGDDIRVMKNRRM